MSKATPKQPTIPTPLAVRPTQNVHDDAGNARADEDGGTHGEERPVGSGELPTTSESQTVGRRSAAQRSGRYVSGGAGASVGVVRVARRRSARDDGTGLICDLRIGSNGDTHRPGDGRGTRERPPRRWRRQRGAQAQACLEPGAGGERGGGAGRRPPLRGRHRGPNPLSNDSPIHPLTGKSPALDCDTYGEGRSQGGDAGARPAMGREPRRGGCF